MNLQIDCSETIYPKIEKILKDQNIIIDADSQIALIEQGYHQPNDKICVVFNPIDYAEACEMIVQYAKNELSALNSIIGFNNNRYAVIEISNILYIEAYGSNITCFTQKHEYTLKKTLYYYENLLKPMGLIRINKSQLVNMMNVKEIIPWFNSRLMLLLKGDQELEVSKLYSKALKIVLDM